MENKSSVYVVLIGALCLAASLLAGCATTMGGMLIKEIDIDAPVENVFARVADVENLGKDAPGVESITNVRGHGLGMTFDWAIEAKGVRTEGSMVMVDYVPNQRIVLHSTCGKIITILFQPIDKDRTRVILSVMYATEVPVEGKPMKKLVTSATSELFEGMLENLKAELET